MRKKVYTVYAEDNNITFIMEDIYKDNMLISTEIKGFYHGEPTEENTEQYYNDLKAKYIL